MYVYFFTFTLIRCSVKIIGSHKIISGFCIFFQTRKNSGRWGHIKSKSDMHNICRYLHNTPFLFYFFNFHVNSSIFTCTFVSVKIRQFHDFNTLDLVNSFYHLMYVFSFPINLILIIFLLSCSIFTFLWSIKRMNYVM